MQILTKYEREKIEFYLKLKWGLREIGRHLKRDHTVISREIQRNSKNGKYVAAAAQKRADFKARRTNKRKLETNEQLHDYVKQQLKSGWSPELIAGRLKEQPPPRLNGASVSHEQIYEYIYGGEGRWEGWWHYLHRARPKRRQRRSRKQQAKTLIKQRISIAERSEEINQRVRYGDWESDLALFKKQRTALSVQYERKAMLTRMHKVQNKSAEENEQAIRQSMDTLPEYLFKSLTFDNGTENVCHTNLGVNTFFCDPYSAWQKGGVENTIGIIRRYLPRTTDLSMISDEEIESIQETINNRPRKKLNYLTPNEVVAKELNPASGALNS
jgi:IS30 family transposase